MLFLGAERGLTRICEMALLQGANINAQSGGLQRSALHWAASKNHVDTCLMLLQQGADPNLTDHNGNTPLNTSWMYCCRDAALVIAAYGGKIVAPGKKLPEGLSEERKVNGTDLVFITAAHAAIKAGLFDRLEQIVMDPASGVDAKELKSLTSVAKASKKPEMVALLQSLQAQMAIIKARAQVAPGA